MEHMEHHHKSSGFVKHWPTILLGLVVAIIFIVVIFSYQVNSTEKAVVTTFGKIDDDSVKEAGFHLRWPYPIQNIYKFDVRMRCFDGNVGQLEEAFTKDGKNLIVGIYVIYNIDKPAQFFKSLTTIPQAEDRLNNIMRTMKNSVIGRYNFDQIVNTDPKKMRLDDIAKEIKQGIAQKAQEQYGLRIDSVGIKSISVPQEISKKVFERMRKEREVVAQKYRSEGKSIADKIRYESDKNRELKLAAAEAKAKSIRAQGDADAAASYAAFKKDPELAAFLRKLESLKKIMGTKTTLILDTDTVPFDLLKTNANDLKPGKSAE